MQAPITQEELDRRETNDNRVRYVGDIMNQLNDINNPAARLKILKALLSNVVSDAEINQVIQDQIDALEEEQAAKEEQNEVVSEEGFPEYEEEDNTKDLLPEIESDLPLSSDLTLEEPTTDLDLSQDFEVTPNEVDTQLPTPDELGIDMTQNF